MAKLEQGPSRCSVASTHTCHGLSTRKYLFLSCRRVLTEQSAKEHLYLNHSSVDARFVSDADIQNSEFGLRTATGIRLRRNMLILSLSFFVFFFKISWLCSSFILVSIPSTNQYKHILGLERWIIGQELLLQLQRSCVGFQAPISCYSYDPVTSCNSSSRACTSLASAHTYTHTHLHVPTCRHTHIHRIKYKIKIDL